MDTSTMSASAPQKSHNLFQVFLRLRPPQAGASQSAERFLAVESPIKEHSAPTHITLNPPNDRRRAIEKFAFTQVFEEDATQLDVFHCTGVIPLVEGVLAPHGGDGTDALLATLGVTGSGKSHTILGSKTQRGMTQLALDVIFRSLGHHLLDCTSHAYLEESIRGSDPSEAAICSASAFLETVYADPQDRPRPSSRAPTPMIVRSPSRGSSSRCFVPQEEEEDDAAVAPPRSTPELHLPGAWFDISGSLDSPKTIRPVRREDYTASPPPPSSSPPSTPTGASNIARAAYHGAKQFVTPSRGGRGHLKPPAAHFMAPTTSTVKKKANHKAQANQPQQGESTMAPPQTPSRRLLNRPSALPQQPDVSALSVSCDPAAEYAVVISMYEVYNDRIFDLLSPPIKSAATKEYRRRPLLFKPTEASPDRKVVAGLRKVVCGSLQQALMVLEAGLHERRVAGTGSNSVSSRSHGFFCVEVKKRARSGRSRHVMEAWGGSTLTIVDLAGSERARDAKTAGATLAEAGKINESLMYLGQCLQMQSDAANNAKPGVVPFRQCKLTELLFSNSFPSTSTTQAYSSTTTRANHAQYSSSSHSHSHSHPSARNPQKAVMIVTADPHGDFNATSQILRYSALAREITVPRIPSITQTILHPPSQPNNMPGTLPNSSPLSSPVLQHSRPFFSPPSPNLNRTFSPASVTSDSETRSTMEMAALEIARLAEDNEYLRSALSASESARQEAEAHYLSMEDRMLELEQAIREDVAAEFERRLELEVARSRAFAAVEAERREEHFDAKIGVLARVTDQVAEEEDGEDGEGEDKENVLVEDVWGENERLRREVEILRRELAGMSPTRRMPLRERGGEGGLMQQEGGGRGSGVGSGGGRGEKELRVRMGELRVSDDGDKNGGNRGSAGSVRSGSPVKKVRKLGGKRWEGGDDEEMF